MCVNPQVLEPLKRDGQITYLFHGTRKLLSECSTIVDEDTGEVFEPFEVGCGHCLECINLHKQVWVARLELEKGAHERSSFLTLTYRETDGDLHKEDLQLFLKRLRRMLEPRKIRFYACGEYGSKGRRPHFHVIIFGEDFRDDRVPLRKDRKGFLMYRSPTLEKVWTAGFSSILPCCKETFGYVTKDMQKLLPPQSGKTPPFTSMSRRPGIGIDQWSRCLTDGKIHVSGLSVPIPRLFKDKARAEGLDLSHVDRLAAAFADARRKLPQKNLEQYQKRLDKLMK